jgi:L-iditol 2-dehydrogenase
VRAVRLHAVQDLRLTEVPDPVLGPGDVVVQVVAAGICGTDRHLTAGEFPCTPPVTLGHEFCGRIVHSDDPALPVGTHVTCDPNIACGTCPACRVGRVNLCHRLSAIGVHRDGGFADRVVIPAHRAFALPDGLHPHHGALAEPLACCLHAVDLAQPVAGQRAIVMGGGVIGLLTQQLLIGAGVEVMMLTRSAAKQALALALGATHVATGPDAARAIWPAGVEIVMECAGVAATVAAAPALAARGGRMVLVGVMPQGVTVPFDPFDLLFREVAVIPSFLNPFTQGRAAAMIADGSIACAPLITRTIAMDEAAAVISAVPGPGDVRVLVLPGA